MDTSPSPALPYTASPLKDSVQKMLVGGLTPSMIAAALKTDPSYVCQVKAELTAGGYLEGTLNDRYEKYEDHNAFLDECESRALQRMATLLEDEDLRSKLPPDFQANWDLKAFQALNNAKRRGQDDLPGHTNAAPVTQVLIELPQALIQTVISPQQQLLEVEGRSLAALDRKALDVLIDERAKNEQPAASK